mmetsp:Transcript_21181/g.72165  ORF Transcript_21181/g.72165 Transcript_21181/m.72165 type:complete len:398 (+) Transcript_21181:359-1552(+)
MCTSLPAASKRAAASCTAASAEPSHTRAPAKSSTTTPSGSEPGSSASWKDVTLPKKTGPASLYTAAGAPPYASPSTARAAETRCALFHANESAEMTTPHATATARLYATVAAVTTATTTPSVLGMRPRRLKVPLSKMSRTRDHMVPTSAASGTASMAPEKATTKRRRNAAQLRPERRVLPPALTLIMLWPIMTHPPMPPVSPVATFARPWPTHSTCVSVLRSVMPSTSCCVSSDSSRPTAPIAAAKGKIIARVSRERGTVGRCGMGSVPATLARSPTVRVEMPRALTAAVTETMAHSGAGRRLVTLGTAQMMAIVATTSPAMVYRGAPDIHPPHSQSPFATRNCSSCARPMTSASPLTNPAMAGAGTSRTSLPSRRSPAPTCMAPASTTAAKRYSTP